MTISSTQPQITVAIKPDGHTDDGIAYVYMTIDEADEFVVRIMAQANEARSSR
jgi:hypothetical protein